MPDDGTSPRKESYAITEKVLADVAGKPYPRPNLTKGTFYL